ARPQPRDHRGARSAAMEHHAGELPGLPDRCLLVEAPWQHADDCYGLILDADLPAEHASITTELALPVPVTEQRDGASAFPRVLQPNASTKDGRNAIGLEEVFGRFRHDQSLGCAGLDDERDESADAPHTGMRDDGGERPPRSNVGHRRRIPRWVAALVRLFDIE